MKQYEKPNVELVPVETQDIIATYDGLDTSIFELEESGWIII